MRVLYVAYPLLPVTEASAGGAEQMLLTLEREMARRGHHTAVAACAGSQIHGELLPTGSTPEQPDRYENRADEHHRHVLRHLCSREARYDLLHDKSGDFWRLAGGMPFPVLATLHLPRSFYGDGRFDDPPANVYFNCVSCAQAATFTDLPRMLGVVRNGIAVEKFALTPRKREYLLWLGRFCEEKGAHIAIDVARRTGRPLVLAGQVYPFSYHQRYYDEQIRPHLQPRPGHAGSQVALVDTPCLQEKSELLSHAHCLLAPSLCDETSSLVALEAMACGTPVIAFRRGGIPEVVADGATGFVVDSVEEMSEAVERAGKIRPEACRMRVEREFSAQRMADEYEELYRNVSDFVPEISH